MNEIMWASCLHPGPLLACVREKRQLTERKARLFMVAVCRGTWWEYLSKECRHAVEVAELYADGLVDESALRQAGNAIHVHDEPFFPERLELSGDHRSEPPDFRVFAGYAAERATNATAATEAQALANLPCGEEDRDAQRAVVCDLFAPFRPPPTLETSLLSDEVLALARLAYEDRDMPSGMLRPEHLERLAVVLGDPVAGHLRSEGPHWRGCFALDAILGRG